MLKFAAILFIQVLCGMEMDLFVPSFPELQHVFNLTPAMVQLTISANYITLCICSLLTGALGDRYNRRTVLLLGLCIFVLGSFLCVIAPNYLALISGRILQGVGIAAPAILSFPILLEDCQKDKQPGMMGTINGVKTLAMAIAPVIGSFVNLYFSWRGNFSILLGMGVLCLATSFFFVPSNEGDKNASLSLQTYVPLLTSQKFLIVVFSLGLITAGYWLFLAMAPIFYMEGMAVPLKHFGYYQGSLTLTFAFISIMSPQILKTFGQKKCLHFGLGACFVCTMLILGMALLQIHQPLIITSVLILLSAAIVFPFNIVYPLSLEILPNTKGRSAGLVQAVDLVLTASLIEIAAYFYNGQFLSIGFSMFISIMLSLTFIQVAINKKWLII
ncbi:MAG: MFS transporter [Candidatus Berkiellales bacterium]